MLRCGSFLFQQLAQEGFFFILRLKGLDEGKMYMDTETGEVYSGALLMNAGINLTPGAFGAADRQPNADGGSLIKYFKAV